MLAEAEDPRRIRREEALSAGLNTLKDYYTGGRWLRDYELDEQGLLPRELKRGVLSQDALYDFLERRIKP